VDIELFEYMRRIDSLNFGEVYFNSIDKDGTGFGYDIKAVNKIANRISIPLIISGGAGNAKHLIDGLMDSNIDAIATANLFNFMGDGLPKARKEVILNKGNIAQWN